MPDDFTFDIKLEDNKFVTPGLTYANSKVPNQLLMPTHDQLIELARTPDGQARLIAILEHYGIIDPLELAKSRALAASIQLQQLPPGSPQWEARAREVVDRYTSNELIGLARGAEQQYTSLVAADDNPDQLFMCISEDDERTCIACEDLAGEEKTWAEWQIEGVPRQHCLGGARCRCDLVAVSRR